MVTLHFVNNVQQYTLSFKIKFQKRFTKGDKRNYERQ